MFSEIYWRFELDFLSSFKGGSRGWCKIDFHGLVFYILVTIIKLCKIRYLNLDKSCYLQETRLFVWKIENFGKLQLPWSLIFLTEILHMFC